MQQIVTIENSSAINIVGATKVISSTSSQAAVETADNLIVISGNNLEVRHLDLENGQVSFIGNVTNIKFSSAAGQKTPLLKRIFR